MNCWSALSFLSPPLGLGLFLGRAARRSGLGRAFALADAVADEGHRVEAAHVLLLEEIDGIAFALGKERDEHIGAGHVVAPRRLDVEDGALDDPLETAGRGRIGARCRRPMPTIRRRDIV